MKLALFAYSRQGCRTARRVMECFPEAEISAYTVERFAGEGFLPLEKPAQPLYAEQFARADALIFVGACGIALRSVAPFVRDKRRDPAVLCVDELASFVIPLLSGHIGGANALARTLAAFLGATAVITTATDINRRFSVDTWASEQGLVIDNMALAKKVSAAVLEGDVPLCSDFPVVTDLPPGITAGSGGNLGICITCEKKSPFAQTLRLIPPVLHLGIGCRKGASAADIAAAVETALEAGNLDRRAVRQVASIDLKAREQGLLDYCRENRWPVSFYPAQALRSLEGDFTPSEFVQRVTGVDNVCERAARMGAARLIVKKTVLSGVTVAVAEETMEVRFG